MRLILNNIAKIIIVFLSVSSITCLSFFEEKQETKDFLPHETELFTWKLLKITNIHKKDEILQISPDYYKYYDVIEIAKGEYQSINDSSVFLTVTIAKTITLDNAYGLFTRERINFEKSYFKNNYSIYWKNKSIAFKGNVIVKVETNDADFIQTQKNIIETVLQKIQSTQTLPETINKISKYCSNDSIIVINEGILQIPYIKNLVACKKVIESKEIDVFYKLYPTNTEASNHFDMLLKIDSSLMILESSKVKIAFKKFGDSFCFIAQYNEWIFGVYNIVDYNAGKQYVNILYKELSTS